MYKCDYCDFKPKPKKKGHTKRHDFNKMCFLKADISFLCVVIDLPLWSVSRATSQYLVGPAALSVSRCGTVRFPGDNPGGNLGGIGGD